MRLDPYCSEINRRARGVAALLGHTKAEPYHLFTAIYLEDRDIQSHLDRYGFNLDTVFEICCEMQDAEDEGVAMSAVRLSPDSLKMYGKAIHIAKRDDREYITPLHLFEAMLRKRGSQTLLLETFVPSQIIFEDVFNKPWEDGPAVNEVTIEEVRKDASSNTDGQQI